MEVNMNLNRMRSQSLDDDDNFSAHSRNSSGFFNSNSVNNSDSECSGPISVRDMIQRYNKQFQKTQTHTPNYKIKHRSTPVHRQHSHHLLAATKSSFCGLNNYGSQMNCKYLNDQSSEEKSTSPLDNHEQHHITCCKNCTACVCCLSRSLKNSITHQIIPTSATTPMLLQENNENNQNPCNHLNLNIKNSGSGSNTANICCNKINTKDILAVKNCTLIDDDIIESNKPNNITNEELNKKDSLNGLQHRYSQIFMEQKKNHLLSIDSIEEAKQLQQQQQQQPTETCYQSKTTIAKTASGVRIIIDIFFDQEQCTTKNPSDIVGSRVETDIPQSRILSEFQQQIMTKNKSNTAIVDTNTAVTSIAATTSSATSLNRG